MMARGKAKNNNNSSQMTTTEHNLTFTHKQQIHLEKRKKKQSATQPRHQLSLNNIKNREKKKKHRILLGVIVRLNLLYDYKERKQNGAACTL